MSSISMHAMRGLSPHRGIPCSCFCAFYYDPVCGVNNKTYGNDCEVCPSRPHPVASILVHNASYSPRVMNDEENGPRNISSRMDEIAVICFCSPQLRCDKVALAHKGACGSLPPRQRALSPPPRLPSSRPPRRPRSSPSPPRVYATCPWDCSKRIHVVRFPIARICVMFGSPRLPINRRVSTLADASVRLPSVLSAARTAQHTAITARYLLHALCA
jgi:hypothetical protein